MLNSLLSRSLIVASLAITVSSCGDTSPKAKTAPKMDTAVATAPVNPVTTSVQTVDTVAPTTQHVAEAAAVQPDETGSADGVTALLKRGRILWFKCRSCHETSEDGGHKVGPNLHDLFGATAGSKKGFVYSKSMAQSGIIWDATSLDHFITKPAEFVKGTKMAFVGINKEADRKALIAYLEVETAKKD